MTGALVLAFVIVVVLPVTFFVIGGILTAILSWFLTNCADVSSSDDETSAQLQG